MRDTTRKINETTEKLDRIKLQSSKMMDKIKTLSKYMLFYYWSLNSI